jgi:hypothetical protein
VRWTPPEVILRQVGGVVFGASGGRRAPAPKRAGRAQALLARLCGPHLTARLVRAPPPAQEWSHASDVWAFGVTMWEVFSNGAEPYAALCNEEVVRAVLAGQRLERPQRCPQAVYSLMCDCWATDPARRPGFDAIIERFK